MSAQAEDHQMEGVDQATGAAAEKGKAKATDTVEESAEDESSDESGVEDQVVEDAGEDDDTVIDPSNILSSRTRRRADIDFKKANEELGPEEEDEDEDDEYNDPDDEMKD